MPRVVDGPAPPEAPARVLPWIVLAQLLGTSTWFAVNAVMPDLQRVYTWDAAAVGTLTSALQAGFITGTLVFAVLALADRIPARRVFFVCALAASALAGVPVIAPVPEPPALPARQGVATLRVSALTSGLCCLAAPWMLQAPLPLPLFLAWLLLWGVTEAGDLPQFSALTAVNAPRQAVGGVLTLRNSIGFAISALSIELFVRLAQTVALAQLLPWLAVGPVLGLMAMRPLLARPSAG